VARQRSNDDERPCWPVVTSGGSCNSVRERMVRGKPIWEKGGASAEITKERMVAALLRNSGEEAALGVGQMTMAEGEGWGGVLWWPGLCTGKGAGGAVRGGEKDRGSGRWQVA
jgi:hypothetical protein